MYKIILMISLLSAQLLAKDFSNKYCSFQLPSGWQCELEGSEWVCQSSNADRKKEAIIILAAKLRGEQDDLPNYQAYLKQPKTYVLPGGKKQVSESKYTRLSGVNGTQWVDSLHLASEVPGFYTRYMATVKNDLGVAVTFSVSKQHYAAYESVFNAIIKSLRVFRQKSVDPSKLRLKNRDEDILDNVASIDDMMNKHDMSLNKKKKKSSSGGSDDLMLYGLLGLAAAIYIIKKKKGKGGKKGKKKAKAKKKS